MYALLDARDVHKMTSASFGLVKWFFLALLLSVSALPASLTAENEVAELFHGEFFLFKLELFLPFMWYSDGSFILWTWMLKILQVKLKQTALQPIRNCFSTFSTNFPVFINCSRIRQLWQNLSFFLSLRLWKKKFLGRLFSLIKFYKIETA